MSILDKASLIQIPSGYKSTKLYSLRPINGDGDFTFSRSSSGTRVNSEGLIEEMSANVPRLDYSGGASCASLLLEPQSTNLITYSEDFSNAAWNKNGASVVSGKLSPSGDTNAFKLVENTANSLHFIESINIGGTGVKTFTIFVNAKEVSKIGLRDAFSTGAYTTFDLNTGSVITEFISNGTISQYGNDFYRISITQPSYTGNSRYQIFLLPDSYVGGNILAGSYLGDGVSGLNIYGAQVELSSYPTSYIISNSGSQTTRTADVCNNAGTAATFNSTEGVLFWDGYIPNDGNEKILQISDGTNNNVVRIFARANGNDVRFQIIVGGVNSFSQEIPMSSNNIYKTSLKYKENDIAIWVNGFELYNANSGSMPSNLNTLEFNSDGDANTFYGKTKQLIVFDEALSDEELSDLTGQVNLSFNNLATFYGYTIL